MDKYRTLFSNTLIFGLGSFGSKLMVFLLLFFYTRVLSLEEFGSVDLIIQAANLLIPIAGLSIFEGTVRFTLDKGYRRTDVMSVSIQIALIGLFCVGVAFPLLRLIGALSDYLILLYIYVFIATIKLIFEQFVRGMGYVKLYAMNGLLTTFMMIFFNIIFLVIFKWGTVGYVLSIVLADALSVMFLYAVANIKKYIRLKDINKEVRSAMLRYSLPMLPTTILWWVTSFSDRYMVTHMLSLSHNGIYSAAYKIPTIITLISAIFSQAWQMSAVTEHNDKAIARFYTNVFNTFQSLVYVVAGGIFLFIKPISMLMGGGFPISYKYTPFLVLSVVFSCFVTFFGSIYVATKRTGRGLVTTIIPGVINILLNLLLIPKLGIHGAAIATCTSYLVAFVIRTFDARAIVGMKTNWLRIGGNTTLLYIMAYFIFTEPKLYYLYLSAAMIVLVAINSKDVLSALKALLKRKSREVEEVAAETN